MGIQSGRVFLHWNYYIALEQDLAKLSRYIEFAEGNFSTYSIELAHLLLAASSEVDVVMKELCRILSPDDQRKNIGDYKRIVEKELPVLIDEKCYVHRFNLTLEPWSNWSGSWHPAWWRSYNKVKHHRAEKYNEANLKNALNAMAGLHALVVHYYATYLKDEQGVTDIRRVTDQLQPEPELIKLDENYYTHVLALN
ncbi:hypothetical protein [Thioalkalivibrio sp. ALJ15]|uniref:hypothetical protein n=1 Tax=Thioalkalivibrio sp. ALJ15 TaxID=748652 RepID=UPI0003624C6D|nr:hypothetical protein [Thioalkalivibrio sp. ALJ15]